ncbi:hypothetical protein BX666DRAFT_1573405 [Dichotomocladium elegans]|nr:hypothetical protein BX666DRAFT_1573405 [Dichotomocladium elegans]
MAIDLIGTNGYLYALQLVNDDFYIAKPVSQLLYPKTRESLWLFLDTLKALFFFKDFLCTTANRAKMELNRRAANNALPTLNTSFPSFASTSTSSPTSSHSSPFIFTSPSHP